MMSERFVIILQYVFIFVTSFTTVNAAVARRLSNTNGNGASEEEKGLYIKLKSSGSSDIDILNHYIHTVPVHHFARHGLCRHEDGKQYFYRAVKTKLCQINDKFVATLVEDLCRHRGTFLDKWVRELFDIDGDGMITHFEKRFYEFDD